jgi:hypothetical protein
VGENVKKAPAIAVTKNKTAKDKSRDVAANTSEKNQVNSNIGDHKAQKLNKTKGRDDLLKLQVEERKIPLRSDSRFEDL